MSQESEIHVQLFKPGPLHDDRIKIASEVRSLQIKTGDIFCRLGKQTFCGIPFEKLVARLTKSQYSHASVAIVEHGEIYMVEVNDMGTLKIRLVDWLDYCATDQFAIYRFSLTEEEIDRVAVSASDFIEADPDYDFEFSNGNKFYCTESVAHIYDMANISRIHAMSLKKVLGNWTILIRPINWLIGKLTGKSLPIDSDVYFVGNKEAGILAAEGIQEIMTFRL